MEEFDDLAEARWHIARWRVTYNDERPHSSLDYPTPRRKRRRILRKIAHDPFRNHTLITLVQKTGAFKCVLRCC